ncbi:hypothetical protein SAMN04488058_104220 [Deinococcus reticulitermitis]|uniref:Uncharacterized protein n=1 Tax=Deinococcus reticulitermitis TaxID=856736 RepID=A0A1H6WZL8_9DEIO|nr:hypothetical protein [Deinococcus reticulitermitis]SEJ17932.1 hypothetical protein SAMN04488058_104220 [Deinococcus reticulitermitis]
MSFNDTIISLRAHILRSGAAAPLNWWGGQPFVQEAIVQRLFPARAQGAARDIVARGVAQLGMQGLTDGLTLFDLGETHETLLQAHAGMREEQWEPGGTESLADTLLTRFPELGSVRAPEVQWRENAVLNRVETSLAGLREPLSDDDVRLVIRVLLDGLKFSSPGRYVQPVVVRS